MWHLLPHGTRNYGSCSMPQLTSCYCLARMQLGFIFLVLSKLISISLYFFNCNSIFRDCSKICFSEIVVKLHINELRYEWNSLFSKCNIFWGLYPTQKSAKENNRQKIWSSSTILKGELCIKCENWLPSRMCNYAKIKLFPSFVTQISFDKGAIMSL